MNMISSKLHQKPYSLTWIFTLTSDEVIFRLNMVTERLRFYTVYKYIVTCHTTMKGDRGVWVK